MNASVKTLIAWTGKAITVTKAVDADLVKAHPAHQGRVDLDLETYVKVMELQWQRDQKQEPQEATLL
jgi:hypothetical protein